MKAMTVLMSSQTSLHGTVDGSPLKEITFGEIYQWGRFEDHVLGRMHTGLIAKFHPQDQESCNAKPLKDFADTFRGPRSMITWAE